MIRKNIEQYLNSLFNLEVVEDITQTKLEKSISYNLAGKTVRCKVKQNESIHFEFYFDILFRCPASFAGIGFITASVYTVKKRLNGMQLIGLDAEEVIEHVNNTEMIISKEVHASLEIQYNDVKEVIKYINFAGELPCQKSY